MIGSSFLQTIYSFTDSVIVGRYVSPTAFGAVGLLSAVIMLLNACCTSLGTGICIVTAQYYGAEKTQDVRETARTGVRLSLMAAILLILLCFGLSRWLIVTCLGTPAAMQNYSIIYLRTYGAGLLFQMIYQAGYGILRAHGDSQGAMLFLLISAILNVGLDLLLVLGFDMEVFGAALATIIAQAGAAAACMIYLRRRYPELIGLRSVSCGSFEKQEDKIRCSFRKMTVIGKIALPILMQTSVYCLGLIGLQRLCNSFGPASIEGYAAMQKVENFIHILPGALNSAMATFAAQNIGAGQYDRVEKGWRFAVITGMAVSAVLAAVMIVFDTQLLSIFRISAEGVKRGTQHLDLLVIFMLVNSLYTITAGLLQGAGDVKLVAFTSFANLFIRVGTAYLMSGTAIGYRCIFWSLPPAWTAAAIINCTRYRSGKWKSKAIV